MVLHIKKRKDDKFQQEVSTQREKTTI